MTCDQCHNEMSKVGRQIQPGHPEVWMDGWVCRTVGCKGYATTTYDGGESRWPALTLMGDGIHLNISGAMKFRDAPKS